MLSAPFDQSFSEYNHNSKPECPTKVLIIHSYNLGFNFLLKNLLNIALKNNKNKNFPSWLFHMTVMYLVVLTLIWSGQILLYSTPVCLFFITSYPKVKTISFSSTLSFNNFGIVLWPKKYNIQSNLKQETRKQSKNKTISRFFSSWTFLKAVPRYCFFQYCQDWIFSRWLLSYPPHLCIRITTDNPKVKSFN